MEITKNGQRHWSHGLPRYNQYLEWACFLTFMFQMLCHPHLPPCGIYGLYLTPLFSTEIATYVVWKCGFKTRTRPLGLNGQWKWKSRVGMIIDEEEYICHASHGEHSSNRQRCPKYIVLPHFCYEFINTTLTMPTDCTNTSLLYPLLSSQEFSVTSVLHHDSRTIYENAQNSPVSIYDEPLQCTNLRKVSFGHKSSQEGT